MTPQKKDGDSVHDLIEERGQIGQWLEKLAGATDKPENVRAKVRAGYEKRLAEIAAALSGARKEIEETLKRHKAALAELLHHEQDAVEKLSEAEVRHSVGELTESAWKKLSHDLGAMVDKVREKVKTAKDAAERTGAALASLDPAATVAATKGVASVGAKPVPTGPALESKMSEFIADPDPVVPTLSGKMDAAKPKSNTGPIEKLVTLEPEVTPVPPAAQPAPATAGPPPTPAPAPKAKQLGFDELAFIKSVTDDEKGAPSAARASGMARLSSSEPVIPDQKVIDAGGVVPPAAPAAPAKPAPTPTPPATPKPAAKAAEPGQGGAKTVKCKECGTMNLPTEWYCEKCGAELSQL